MVIEICASLATLAFIILVIYLVQTLRVLQVTLKDANNGFKLFNTKIDPLQTEALKFLANTNDLIHTKINPLHHEALKILESTNEIAESLANQIQAFDPFVESISNVGLSLQEATQTISEDLHDSHLEHEKKKTNRGEKFLDILDLAALGINIWKQIKKRR